MNASYSRRNLFDSMIERIEELSKKKYEKPENMFPKWFSELFYLQPNDFFISDGSRDGKIDMFFTTNDGEYVKHHIVNSKFTKEYNKTAPISFYEEILDFCQIFENKKNRKQYIEKYIRKDLRARYLDLLNYYDNDKAELVFITNCSRNQSQFYKVENLGIKIFHLEEILQNMIDDIEGAMPRTHKLILTGIKNVLSPEKTETTVPTSIIFARVLDFIKYMRQDKYDLLFSRNIRFDLGNTEPNVSIKETFRDYPKEFAFSNNGLTLLCEKYSHDPGIEELSVENPRIVNGSQTLHSVRFISRPSSEARIMVRIVQVQPMDPNELVRDANYRREIVNKISVRSNLQNPIKKWNLVANDDYQQSLKRFFRTKGYFYSTRKKEWTFRKTELRNVGIKEGPFITNLTQLIASYLFKVKMLGPANAKGNLNKLFDNDKSYKHINGVEPITVYQLFLLNKIIQNNLGALSKLKYVKNVRNHVVFVLFAVYTKFIDETLNLFASNELTDILERSLDNQKLINDWKLITKEIITFILKVYVKQNKDYKKREGNDLTYNNFFKTTSYVQPILNASIPGNVTKRIRNIIRKIQKED